MSQKTLAIAAASGLLLALSAASANAQNFNGTCINVHYRGPILVATCLNAYGVYNTSSIDSRSCPPEAINNSNGNVVCAAGAYGYRRPRYGY